MDSPTPDEIFTHFKAALVSWDAKAAKKLLKKADGIHMEKERRGLRHLDVFMATFAIEWETLGDGEDDFNQLLSDLIDSDFIEKHPVIMVELIQNERLKAVQQVIKKGGVRESWKDKLWIQNIISNFRKMEHKTGRINPHKVDDYIDTILLMVKTGIGLKYADIASNPVYKRTCPIKFVSGLYPLRERTGLFRELVEAFDNINGKIALISSQNDLYELFSEYPIENKREAREIADVIEYFRGVAAVASNTSLLHFLIQTEVWTPFNGSLKHVVRYQVAQPRKISTCSLVILRIPHFRGEINRTKRSSGRLKKLPFFRSK